MRWLFHPVAMVAWCLLLAFFLIAGGAFIHYYNSYASIIDTRLNSPIFTQTSLIFAGPAVITPGETLSFSDLEGLLRRAGYGEGQSSPVGSFAQVNGSVLIHPGPEAYHARTPARIDVDGGSVSAITDLNTQAALSQYTLEPELLTTLFDQNREKRRLISYQDMPPVLVQAVLDTEDRDFFHHGAVNYWRIPSAVYRHQGASTIDMQVARSLFLSYERDSRGRFVRTGLAGWRRKLQETLIALVLEQRLNKTQIFELYANEIYLGQRGTYSINGFGEGADAYFDKSVSDLTLPEAALLAGIIHGPQLDSPYTHAENAKTRRDHVLLEMQKAGAISEQQRTAAVATPIVVAAANVEGNEAPYFVDMVRDKLSAQFSSTDLTSETYRIYTTLDPRLQEVAAQSVSDGMKIVDKLLAAQNRHVAAKGRAQAAAAPLEQAQVAIVVLDPHTGDILALSGGRDYRKSQLNHALASRPTGSIFKPFVYATALETALLPMGPSYTETSTVMDEPTTFEGGYQPKNFAESYMGQVTLRTALEHSLNNGTIALAQAVGYGAVADLAHAAGISSVRPTPSEAIGTYNASPLTMAGAYTVFANGGVRRSERELTTVENDTGSVVYEQKANSSPVLDPRIAFLTTNLMQSVLSAGTGHNVRDIYNFEDPAAGKTGSSHDAWFAGYTSNLLCVVWVGLDDYKDIELEGNQAALPIWAEFMKRATAMPGYRDLDAFKVPEGVVAVKIDTASNQVATPLCPPSQVETDYYLAGTEPRQSCKLHPMPSLPGRIASAFDNLLHGGAPPAATQTAPPTDANNPPSAPVVVPAPAPAPRRQAAAVPAKPAPPPPAKKKGFWARVFGGGGGGGN